MVVFLICKFFGLPSVILVGAALIIKVPEKAPLPFELFLRKLIPLWILYPKIGSDKDDVNDQNISDSDPVIITTNKPTIFSETSNSSRSNLSGIWKRVKLVNYEAFIGAQGLLTFIYYNYIKQVLDMYKGN